MQSVNYKKNYSISTIEILSMALESLWSNKLRTGLTMLGMIIGIASVIGITSIGQGVQKSTEEQIKSLGSDVLQVLAGEAKGGNVSQGQGSSSTLTWEDAQAIADEAPAASAVSGYLQRKAQVVYEDENASTTVYGTDLDFPETRNTFPDTGRYFNQAELDESQQVVVLAPTVKKKLFPEHINPIGNKIRIQGEIYQVVGVMEAKGSQGPMDRDDAVYIPLTTMSARIVGNNSLFGISVNGIYVKYATEEQSSAAEFQITNLLRSRHNIQSPDDDDFRVTNQADILETLATVTGLLTTMIGAIAGISLVVGGIGIANIMLVSVVERTREIGIRKALGATNGAILNQFLVEAVVISTVGGVIGIVTGSAIAFLVATVAQFPFIISPSSIVISFTLSTVVGLIAGVIPARNASKLDPITALRSD
ncbi:MAG: ABC transporter permease [Rivularia sp. ALOHA_DT_140]|nr:ABC transporter permease [Rivularia sp. ALOHA_DT_140]